MIDEEDWSAMDVDVKGAAFEGLLEKAASEGKKGAGQYFTPRPLIQAIVSVMKPDPRGKPDFRICDPACGTGGFLVCSYEWLVSKPVSGVMFDRADARRIKSQTFIGQDLVPRPRRLALMNLFLHGVEPHIYLGDPIYEPDHGERYDLVSFLNAWLNSPTLNLADFLTGIDQVKLNRAAMDQIPVPIAPLPEQQEIVRRVEELFALADQLEARLVKARGQVDRLTPSLLARAWTLSPPARSGYALSLRKSRLARSQPARLAGQLVPQDPNDEPADKLLERIRGSAKDKT